MKRAASKSPSIHPVILCGGSGSRLWPVSRSDLPKQFLALVSERTMLQDTALLVSDQNRYAAPTYLTGEDFRFLVEQQIQAIGQEIGCLMMEPLRRNTAPAIALAALSLVQEDPDAIMLVMPSDHVLTDKERFQRAVHTAAQAAQDGHLVTFGMTATQPETGYGYICAGEALGHGAQVDAFVEKPDLETAEKYIQDGRYLWNSGMFMFKAQQFVQELAYHHPDIIRHCKKALIHADRDGAYVRPNEEHFAQCTDVSIDYAVMEHTQNAAVVRGDFGWSDVGSWTSLSEVTPPASDASVVLQDCVDTYVRSETGRVIAAIGLQDHVVVDTPDAVLIAPKARSQDVKNIVERLRNRQRSEADHHACVRRPWGTYEGIHLGGMHQVKHIVVDPDGILSAQYHHHRAEHWIIVSGEAEVTVGEEVKTLKENQSVYIPVEAIHRLANKTDKPLHLIEVQYGDYLGEDDIVRLDDVYGRVANVQAAE